MPREGAGFGMISMISGAGQPAGTGQSLPVAGNVYPENRAGISDETPAGRRAPRQICRFHDIGEPLNFALAFGMAIAALN
jgi:hypothetical protein